LIAVNIALCLQELQRCLLLDLQGPSYSDDLLLRLKVKRSWDALLPVSKELTITHIERATAIHPSGLCYLAGAPGGVEGATPGRIANLLMALKEYFDWLVLDCPTGSHPWTEVAMSVSEIGLLVATPDPPSLRACSRLLNYLGLPNRSKVRLILNQVRRVHPARATEIARKLSCPLLIELPVDGQVIADQVHHGHVFSTNGLSPFTVGIRQLVERITQIEGV
jgi:MinD-like ATPase involved in chromosome partitioning or flagellar assembly